jgi:hypothetical protein
MSEPAVIATQSQSAGSRALSPMIYAGQAKTPAFFVHGESGMHGFTKLSPAGNQTDAAGYCH